MAKGRVAEEQQTILADGLVDLATAGQTGDWVSLAQFNHLAVIVMTSVGTAGEDVTVTISQATDNAGTGSKALNFTELYQKEAVDIQTVGQFTKVTQAASNTYVSATGGESEQLIIIEFDAAELDVDNGFDHVQASLSDPGSTAQIGGVLYSLTEPSYAEEPALSAL